MNHVAEALFEYLRNVIYTPQNAVLDTNALPESFRDYGKGVVYFSECMLEITALATELSNGNLNGSMPSQNNAMAASLKGLQATLKHLTWQTQQVSKGDYQQRVDFMGDFSVAFNSMIEQLDQQRTALLAEIDSGRAKTQALSQSYDLLESITKNISQWIVVVDRVTKEWLYANHKANEILLGTVHIPDVHKWLNTHIDTIIKTNEVTNAELEWLSDGVSQYFSLSNYPLNWFAHNALAFVFTDISSEKTHIHTLEDAAYHDTLTGLYNRRHGMGVLTEWLGASKSFMICFVDIDNLKHVNDIYGHVEGDNYILIVSEILSAFSKDSIVCRLGGDEFMLLTLGAEIKNAEITMESIIKGLEQYSNNSEPFYHHSISYGVIEVGTDNKLSDSQLLSIADEKMYNHKRSRKALRK